MNGNYIGLTALIDRVKTNPLLRGLDFDVAVRYAVDCIKLIGSKEILMEKPVRIGIQDYRGELPLDIFKVMQVRRVENAGEEEREFYQGMREASDTFHVVFNRTTLQDDSYRGGHIPENTYKINNYYIYTGFEEGVVDMMYLGLALDSYGYPLIPDDASIIKAIEFYIKTQYYMILLDLGKIQPYILEKAEQEYTWYIGKAQSEAAITSLDEQKSISNILHKLFIERHQHDEFYRNLGTTEHWRRQ